MKFIAFLFLSLGVFAQNSQSIKVILTDKQTKLPLENINLSIPKYNLTTSSNAQGVARFESVPLGRFELEVSSVDFGKRIYKELLLENAKQLVLELELQPTALELNEVEISDPNSRSSALMSVESITNEQIMRFPATFFDPARLVMSYAGVANQNDQANNISVRGNLPEFVQWRLEGAEIVNPNHLSNAGTFSDKPTAVGGGTNILSAQMLGKMDFLSGAFPAEYGNALGGVFDMNLRTGDSEKFHHVVQAGLIGIDLSSEGPLNKKTGSSYLVNYRYSFTGLLGQMGVNFGGEDISFQDLAFNFNFPTKKAGTFMLFGMGGISSNIFVPESDTTKWESDKEFNNIDFKSRMGLIGVKHNIELFKNWNLRSVLVESGLENLRNAYTETENVNYDYSAKNYISFSTVLSGNIDKHWALNAGLNLSHQFVKFNIINSDTRFFSFDNFIVQPYFRLSNRQKGRFNYNVGLGGSFYSLSESYYLEPRLSANYYVAPKHQLQFAYGLHSQTVQNRMAFNLPYKPSRAHHINLGYQYDFNKNQLFKVEAFYQSLFNLIQFDSVYISTLNGYEIGYFRDAYFQVGESNQGRNYGIELSYKYLLEEGFFALANATFYKSQFKAFDGKFYDTRYSGDYIYNLTLGKEWERSNGKIWGLNGRVNWVGGFRDYYINVEETQNNLIVYFDFERPLVVKYDDYFRVDLRAYLKRTKKRGSETISIDLQNFTGRKNPAYNYFDTFLMRVETKEQLGLIPMLNYRWEF